LTKNKRRKERNTVSMEECGSDSNLNKKRKEPEGPLKTQRDSPLVLAPALPMEEWLLEPHLLECSTEQLYQELERLEMQRADLKSALKGVKHRMSNIRRLVGARNAAQRQEDLFLKSRVEEAQLQEEVVAIEENVFPEFGGRLPYEVILEIFSFITPSDLARCAMVSTVWLGVANENLLWRHFVTKKWAKYSHKILNDPSEAQEDITKRDWKKYFRWCESNNLRWANHLDYLTDLTESKRQYNLGRKFLSRGNQTAALKALQASNRLVPSETTASLIESIVPGDESVEQERDAWQCPHCTFINTNTSYIRVCEMCGLSNRWF